MVQLKPTSLRLMPVACQLLKSCARTKCFIRNLGPVISVNPLGLPVPARTHFTLAIEPSHTFALVSKNRRHSRTPSWLTKRGHVPMQVLSHCNLATLHSTEIFTRIGMRLVSIIFRKWKGSIGKHHPKPMESLHGSARSVKIFARDEFAAPFPFRQVSLQ